MQEENNEGAAGSAAPPQPPPAPVPAAQPPRELIPIDEHGLMTPKNETQLKAYVEYLIRSKLIPEHFDTMSKAIIAIQYGAAYGFNAIQSLRRIYVVNGSPSFWGEFPLAIVKRSGQLVHIEEYLVDKDYVSINSTNKNLNADVFGAITKTWRLADLQMLKDYVPQDKLWEIAGKESHFTVKDAERAGLLTNPKKLYGKYLKDMLKYRARTRNLLDQFPDVMQGLNVLEYHFPEELDRLDTMKDVSSHVGSTPRLATAEDVNKDFLDDTTT